MRGRIADPECVLRVTQKSGLLAVLWILERYSGLGKKIIFSQNWHDEKLAYTPLGR